MYTKGEWRTHPATLSSDYIVAGNRNVCRVLNTGDIEMLKANAQLISAAPRMAKFLENLCAEFEDYGKIDESFYRTAIDILAAIRGGE